MEHLVSHTFSKTFINKFHLLYNRPITKKKEKDKNTWTAALQQCNTQHPHPFCVRMQLHLAIGQKYLETLESDPVKESNIHTDSIPLANPVVIGSYTHDLSASVSCCVPVSQHWKLYTWLACLSGGSSYRLCTESLEFCESAVVCQVIFSECRH